MLQLLHFKEEKDLGEVNRENKDAVVPRKKHEPQNGGENNMFTNIYFNFAGIEIGDILLRILSISITAFIIALPYCCNLK